MRLDNPFSELSPMAKHPDRKMFSEWMIELANLCREYWKCDQFDPFSQNEAASVSALVAAAARARFQPIAEWPVKKVRGGQDGKGRLDLWFNRKNTSYSFEFKRWRGWEGGIKDLRLTMGYSFDAIQEVDPDSHHRAYGGVIAPFHDPSCVDVFAEFADQEHIGFAVGRADEAQTAFFFKELERK